VEGVKGADDDGVDMDEGPDGDFGDGGRYMAIGDDENSLLPEDDRESIR
jgi:hypothetical protein